VILNIPPELSRFDPRKRPGQRNENLVDNLQRSKAERRMPNVKYAPMKAASSSSTLADKDATFGQRLAPSKSNGKGKARQEAVEDEDVGMEVTWVPSGKKDHDEEEADVRKKVKSKAKKAGVETFGHGMERGGVEPEADISETERSGRKHRRQNVRSGSRNTFRRMGT
jgi:ribosome biogenesis protein ENP2